MQPVVIYCYDAYCGWCYGFSPVIKKIAEEYKDRFDIEVLSGGMILPVKPTPIAQMAAFMLETDKKVEALTGVAFGKDYLWHVEHPDNSDWYPNSEKPAIAMCVFKEYFPSMGVKFAADLQYALHYEGRDLCDDEAYRHLLEIYHIPAEAFYQKLHSQEYKERAYEEFAVCRQLKVTGFPAMFLQVADNKIHAITEGYADYNTVKTRIDEVLKDLALAHQQ